MIRRRNYAKELARTADRLHKHEAEELLAILAAHFDVPVPTLRWSFRGNCGRAYLQEWAISAGPLAWRGVTNSLLHEFAHLLNHKRNPAEAGKRPHGKAEVAEVWHGDASKYGWGTEYLTIMAAGPTKEKQ